MPTGRNGVKKILEGVLQAHKGLPPKEAPGRLVPRHVIINCVDPRVAPSSYAQLNVNEMFLIRNAGNMVPHSSFVTTKTAATEPAVLELAFTKFNTVKQVALCGHSDCKAMKFLHSMKDDPEMFNSEVSADSSKPEICNNPLRTWIVNHGARSLAQFLRLENKQFKEPLLFNAESPYYKVEAWIDPENKYDEVDKLAMVNSLIQIENVGSYSFMQPGFDSGKLLLHGLWYDVARDSVMVFSRSEKCFIPVEDASTIDLIVKEAKETVSKIKSTKLAVEREAIEAAVESARLQGNQCVVEDYRNYPTVDKVEHTG